MEVRFVLSPLIGLCVSFMIISLFGVPKYSEISAPW